MNVDGNRFASVDHFQHCVYIYSLDGEGLSTGDPSVSGVHGEAGSTSGRFRNPNFTCFVHRGDDETLLVCDSGNHRVVEVNADGTFKRVIPADAGIFRYPRGIAYCGASDLIAVTQNHAVHLLDFNCGAVRRTILTTGRDGRALETPSGVTFTAAGAFILVAEWGGHRVSKFSAASGRFIEFVAHKDTHGPLYYPRDVVVCEDGSILVAAQHGDCTGGVVCVRDGVTVRTINTPTPYSLSYSKLLNGVVVKDGYGHSVGSVMLLR